MVNCLRNPESLFLANNFRFIQYIFYVKISVILEYFLISSSECSSNFQLKYLSEVLLNTKDTHLGDFNNFVGSMYAGKMIIRFREISLWD